MRVLSQPAVNHVARGIAAARGDAGAAKLHADIGRFCIAVIRLDLADPVFMHVAAQHHGRAAGFASHLGT